MKNLIIAALSVGLLLGAFTTASAATAPKGKDKAVQKVKKAKYRPFRGTIKAVDQTAKTITLQGKKAQQFLIIAETKLKKDGQVITLDKVAVGDKVGGRARETAAGKWEALTLNFRTPKAKPAKGGKKAK